MPLVRYMKRSVSKSKPFQSSSKVGIPVRARREGRLSRSKLKQVFLIETPNFLCTQVNVLGSAHEKFFKNVTKQDLLFYFVSFVRRGKLNTVKPKWNRGKEMA